MYSEIWTPCLTWLCRIVGFMWIPRHCWSETINILVIVILIISIKLVDIILVTKNKYLYKFVLAVPFCSHSIDGYIYSIILSPCMYNNVFNSFAQTKNSSILDALISENLFSEICWSQCYLQVHVWNYIYTPLQNLSARQWCIVMFCTYI